MERAGRSAFLAAPYDVVGPFSLDELETQGRYRLWTMSRHVAAGDGRRIRSICASKRGKKRRAFLFALNFDDDREYREVLSLPMEGALEPRNQGRVSTVAKTAHPDAGGSGEHYRRIAEARDALLIQFGTVP